MFLSLILSVVALALLIKGADIFIDASAGVGRRLKIPEFVIGTTLVAIGTSLPELTVSIVASVSHNPGLVVGNLIGSNISNIGLILALCAIMYKGIPLLSKTFLTRDIPFMLLAGFAMLVLCYDPVFQNHGVRFNRLTLGDGIVLLIFFVIFLFYIFGTLKTGQVIQEEFEEKEIKFKRFPLLDLIFRFCLGLGMIIAGGRLLVDQAVSLSYILGLSQTTMGLTLIAVGTSFPEAFTSFVALRKNKKSIALGNIIGSNTINIFFIAGLSSVIFPIEIQRQNLIHIVVMIGFTLLLFIAALFNKHLSRPFGFVMLAGYVFYLYFSVTKDMLL